MNERLILQITLAAQIAAAILLAAGLFTPAAGVLLVTLTASFVFVSWPHEYPLYLLFAAVAIAVSGGTGAVGVGLGLAGAVTLEALRQFNAQRMTAGGAMGAVVAIAEQENPRGRERAG
jgi:membrane-bound ClpP family serine protease